MSSTEVRAAMNSMDSACLERALSPEAAQLLLKPSAAEREMFTTDFAKLGRPPAGQCQHTLDDPQIASKHSLKRERKADRASHAKEEKKQRLLERKRRAGEDAVDAAAGNTDAECIFV